MCIISTAQQANPKVKGHSECWKQNKYLIYIKEKKKNTLIPYDPSSTHHLNEQLHIQPYCWSFEMVSKDGKICLIENQYKFNYT